ncbi:MAG: DUF5667 domain-containing protein [Patescibacteria group bacterium]
MDNTQIENAKKRIWSRMQSKLPDRGLSPYQVLLSTIKSASSPTVSRLKRVQYKEHLLDILPDRPEPALSLRRVWGVGSLVAVLSLIFMPVLQKAPMASASSVNTLEVVEGQVLVNGQVVKESVVIQEGDRIETLEGAMAHVYFLDDSRMTLAPQTVVDIVDTEVNPLNRADTKVAVYQESGRAWVQVLNLLASNDSYFLVTFPDGQAKVDSRASFDLEVGEETRVSVARNLVDLSLKGEDEVSYAGTLGQGAEILNNDGFIATENIPAEREEEFWWAFNYSYGRTYAQALDDQYKEDATLHAMILPTHPLYFLKTFREDMQVSLAFTSEAKEELLVQQVENRLNEAQILLAQGETAAATEVLNTYHDTVEEALENTDNPVLLAKLEVTQKQMLTAPEVNENTVLLEDHLASSSALVSSTLEGKAETKMLSASQKLERVPDLIANGEFDQALIDLSAYQVDSLSILTELENVPMEQRQEMVSALLDQKLKDVQLLRVIASMPETSAAVSIDTQMLEQMSMMVLSLKEMQLSDLSTFFESTDYDLEVQYSVYNRLKGDVQIDEELSQQFQDMEDEIQNSSSEPVIEIEEVETVEVVPAVETTPSIETPSTDSTKQ